MRNKTIAVIADKETGVVKSIETEVIVSQRELESEIRWECMAAIKKIINKKKDRKSTRLNSSHRSLSRMPSSA